MSKFTLNYVLTSVHGEERNQFERSDSFVGNSYAEAIKSALKFWYDKYVESIVFESIDADGYITLEAYTKPLLEGFSYDNPTTELNGDALFGEPTVIRTGDRKLFAKEMFSGVETLLVVKSNYKAWKAAAGRLPNCVKVIDLEKAQKDFSQIDFDGLKLVASLNSMDFYTGVDESNHNHPKGVVVATVEGLGSVYVPLKAAKALGHTLLDTTGDVVNYDSAVYSRSQGYYDKEVKVVYQYALHDKADFVTLHNGKTELKSNSVYVERHQAWYRKNETLTTQAGKSEVKKECGSYEGAYYHMSESFMVKCGHCGNYHHKDVTEVFDRVRICEDCQDSLGDSLRLMSYSTDVCDHSEFGKPELKVNGKDVLLGFELEVKAKSRRRFLDINLANSKHMNADKKARYTVATSDGSLDDTFGLEYIFRPNSIKGHEVDLKDFMKRVGKHLKVNAGDGYGLHVHVSAHFLSNVDKVNIQNFTTFHEGFCRKVGGRDETSYQRKKNMSSVGLKNISSDRYNMVNTSNDRTIEFRFPKSLVDSDHILRNLELALAITLYCKYHGNCTKMKDIENFKSYILSNKKQYRLLSQLITEDKNKEALLAQEAADQYALSA